MPGSEGAPAELLPDDSAFDISDAGDVAALLEAEGKHFWHRARNTYIADRLGRLGVQPGASVLELGCGAGCVAANLARAGYRVTGVDGHRALIEVAKARAPNARFFCRDLRHPVTEIAAERFAAVGLFDVIEHLDNPVQALSDALAHTAHDGVVVGTVPALMGLWSSIDVHAGHKTRYSARSLRDVLMAVPEADVVEVQPFFRSLVPIMWAQRQLIARRGDARDSIQNLSVPPRPLNHALHTLVSVERRADRWFGSLPGASLWFALRRR